MNAFAMCRSIYNHILCVMETKINSNLQISEEQGRNSDWHENEREWRTEFTHGPTFSVASEKGAVEYINDDGEMPRGLPEGVSLQTGSNRIGTKGNYLEQV